MHPEPANKLTRQEREHILQICNLAAYQSRPSSQIVPVLADRVVYMDTELSFYRVLRPAAQLHYRGKARAPRPVTKPTGCQDTRPNQVWSRDITYLAAAILGRFYRLYLVMDISSRKIVAWEVHETEKAKQAGEFTPAGRKE